MSVVVNIDTISQIDKTPNKISLFNCILEEDACHYDIYHWPTLDK